MANIFSTGLSKLKKGLQYGVAGPIGSSAANLYDQYKASKGNTSGNIGTVQSTLYNPSAPRQSVDYSKMQSRQSPSYTNLPNTVQTSAPRPNVSSSPVTDNSRYNSYLKNRAGTAQDIAQKSFEEQNRIDQENYELAKQGLLQNKTNLGSELDRYRSRNMEDIGQYKTSVENAKKSAQTQSGASQRSLAEARRQTMGQREKQYAALGTIDSYGTGSFTMANANDDTNFIRQTNQNLESLNDRLYQLDQDGLNFEKEATRKLQDEETKYNYAVQEIERQLAGNEQLKGQALRAAALQLQSKQAEIQDEFDQLTLKNEQEKNQYQMELDKISRSDEQFKSMFQGASQSFLDTGKPSSMNDWLIVNKYPDTYKSILEGYKNGGSGQNQEKQGMVSLIDRLLGSDTGQITGLAQIRSFIPGTQSQTTKNIYEQLKGMLSLENRQKLKGSGAISDYESKILERAASTLGRNLSNDEFINELNLLKQGLSGGNSSQNQMMRVVEIATGATGTIPANEFNPNIYRQI